MKLYQFVIIFALLLYGCNSPSDESSHLIENQTNKPRIKSITCSWTLPNFPPGIGVTTFDTLGNKELDLYIAEGDTIERIISSYKEGILENETCIRNNELYYSVDFEYINDKTYAVKEYRQDSLIGWGKKYLDDNGNQIANSYWSHGALVDTNTYESNSNGNVIEWQSYFTGIIERYSYDQFGNLTEKIILVDPDYVECCAPSGLEHPEKQVYQISNELDENNLWIKRTTTLTSESNSQFNDEEERTIEYY